MFSASSPKAENIEQGKPTKKVGFSNGRHTGPKPLPTGGIYTYPAADPARIIKPGFSTVEPNPETILGNAESVNTYNRTIDPKASKASVVKYLQGLYKNQFTKEQIAQIRKNVEELRKTPNILAHYRALNQENLLRIEGPDTNLQSRYGLRKSVPVKVTPAARNIWGNAAFAPWIERTRKRKQRKRRASRKLLH